MYKGSCLCGLVRWTFTGTIESVTACNCSACRRYGVLWAYGHVGKEIVVEGETSSYSRGRKNLEFNFCKSCGCVISWSATKLDDKGRRRIAVNTRLIEDPNQIASLPIDHFDGLDKFDDLPRDHRCVKDMWF
jgi:hypothetical protein